MAERRTGTPGTGSGALAAVLLLGALWLLPPATVRATTDSAAGEATVAAFVAARRGAGDRPNRLISETSPYLLLHAFNPVDWYPWGPAAFEKARREKKPIFLSIGYLTCHWCHVMARESFDNAAVAELLNRHFVSIKVDREERPDIDRLYQAAGRALNGSAGWPLSVFLTPDRRPFYAGTYFPPEPRDGLPGFKRVLETVSRAWRDDPGRIAAVAGEITARLNSETDGPPNRSGDVDESLLAEAFEQFEMSYDMRHGGFGRGAKFPQPSVLAFLLHWYHRSGDRRARKMVFATLDHMRAGGIHDHVGGGFHRYSVDRAWRVPHFEKMLYDQAQLATLLLEARQLGGPPAYEDTARRIFDWVRRSLADPAGAFCAARDADSPRPEDPSREGEGAYYLWRLQEIREVLGREKAEVFAHVYGVRREGNVENDPWKEFPGRNILYRAHAPSEAAARFGVSEEEIRRIIADSLRTLRRRRAARPAPRLDDKVITAWNGLMISALARGYQVLGDAALLADARRAAAFILEELYDPQRNRLLRRYRGGRAGLDGHLDDYAFFSQALLDLYESDFDIAWLQRAVALTEAQAEVFGDDGRGRFFETPPDPSLPLRLIADSDGALPAGNSVAAANLLRLAAMTGRSQWRRRAERILSAYAGTLRQYPEAMPRMLTALSFRLDPPRQVVIAGRPGAADTRRMLQVVHRSFSAGRVVLLADGGPGQRQLAAWLPFVADLKPTGGRSTAFVCRNHVCRLPTTDPGKLSRELTENRQQGESHEP